VSIGLQAVEWRTVERKTIEQKLAQRGAIARMQLMRLLPGTTMLFFPLLFLYLTAIAAKRF
jgi:hypothetical protein